MNKKGQALIEFILIMPVFMVILMSLIDVGNIYMKKNELNNDLQIIETMYQNKDSQNIALYTSNKDITLEENIENDLITLTLKKEVKINAPILTNILGKKYTVETKKTIYKENE
ncbi:MAG: pilus assembly protein [Bacilli bacterium]|nr:pilus assembly protein [Bacilli bacterium]